jgi:hypothetical protein
MECLCLSGFLACATSGTSTKPVPTSAVGTAPVDGPKVLSVTGVVVDAQQKPVAQAFVCDSFDADLMLGMDGVPRVIGLRTPKVRAPDVEGFVGGFQTSCAKTNAQGVFSLTAPVQKTKAPSGEAVETTGFAPGTEFTLWAGSGLSRTPAKGDRLALGIPSFGARVRLEKSTTEQVDVGRVVLKAVKPLTLSYRTPKNALLRAVVRLSVRGGPEFFRLNFADAEPSWPRGKPLPVKAEGSVELPLPVEESYDVTWEAELVSKPPQALKQGATHAAPVEFVIE